MSIFEQKQAKLNMGKSAVNPLVMGQLRKC